MTTKIGFGEVDLWGTWKAAAPICDEIVAHAFYVSDGTDQPAALVVADIGTIWPSLALDLRAAVAEEIGASPDRVGIFSTQNHGTPSACGLFDTKELAHRFVTAVRRARDGACEAQMAYAETCAVHEQVICRRISYSELGAFTFFFGYETTGNGYANAAELLRQAMHGLAGGDKCTRRFFSNVPIGTSTVSVPDVPSGMAMQKADDNLIQSLFFKTPSGEPIGSISRWAAHPATSTGIEGSPGGDYPVYVRRQLREAFGGAALFLTGPCGDQCSPVKRKSIENARILGTFVAGNIMNALAGAVWTPLDDFSATSKMVSLSFRKDMPVSCEAARCLRKSAEDEISTLVATGAHLSRIKTMAEKIEFLSYISENSMEEWTGITCRSAKSGNFEHPLFGLRLGNAVIAGLPGEPFGKYSVNLRNEFPCYPVIVSEECNGYLSYFPTKSAYPDGGYEVCASFFAPDAEDVLLEAGYRIIHDLHNRQASDG